MKKKIVLIITLVVLFLAALLLIVFNLRLNPLEEGKKIEISSETELDQTLKETEVVEDPENINILIVGSDVSGELADVIMLAKINPEERKVDVISVPRDTRVKINGKFMKINSVLNVGKMSGVKQTIEYLLKTNVDNSILFSTDTFRETIDALGGVDFNVPQNMKYSDPIQNLEINLKKGYQHLDGKKAEQLVRYRKYPMGDLDRIKVQQDFFKELISQKLNYSLINNADELIKTFVDNVNTDLTLKDLIPYINLLKSINNVEVNFYTIPGVADYVDGISYFLIDEKEIASFLLDYNTTKENTEETMENEIYEEKVSESFSN